MAMPVTFAAKRSGRRARLRTSMRLDGASARRSPQRSIKPAWNRGGGSGRIVSAGASREARARGVEEGMEMRRALELCPDAILRPTRLKHYRERVAELRELLRADCERLEELGLDGTFLELASPADGLAHAAELCVRLQAEFGLPAVAGIAPTRFVAVLAARHAGPGGIRRVNEAEVEAFLAPFPVDEIWGLGPATAQRLACAMRAQS